MGDSSVQWDEGVVGEVGESSYAVAPIQARFWLMHEVRPDLPLCNLAISLRLEGELDADRMRACVNGLVTTHETLRTTYSTVGDELLAHVRDADVQVDWEFVDFAADGVHAKPGRTLDEVLDTAAAHRFDLTAAPLLRATLVRLGARHHVLLLVAHHIAVDGTAMFHLLPTELCARYDQGGNFAAAPATTYARVAHVRRERERSPEAALDREYFRQCLAGAPVTLELPTDRAFPPVASMRGGHVERHLDRATSDAVNLLATRLGVRPFDIMAAAFVAQMARYSGQLDLVFGTPVANRRDVPGMEALIGCCIDTQLLRVTFESAPSFEAIARAVSAARRQARQHTSLSFGSLLDALTTHRDPSRNAIYQVMFNYMGFALADVKMASLKVEAARRPVNAAMVDLSLDVTEQASGYALSLEYNSDVFDRDHVAHMLGHYAQVLEAGLSNPATSLGALRLLEAAEREAVLTASAGATLALPRSGFVQAELLRIARRDPMKPALRSLRVNTTYGELLGRALELASRLRDEGVGPGVFVAVVASLDPADAVCAILGVLFAGGAFVPLDASLPEARLDTLVRDCGARVCVAEWSVVPAWAKSMRVVSPRSKSVGSALDSEWEIPSLTGEHEAYVIYTSGSTGNPKGVVVSQRNLLHQWTARLEQYGDEAHRVLAPYSPTFDSFLAGLTAALATGGTLYVMDEASRRDPMQVAARIGTEGITHLDVVPSMYAALLELASSRELSSLRRVICGGEALPDTVVAQHFQRLPQVQLFNEYGPTEASVFASMHEVLAGLNAGSIPIGRPIPNTRCWVVDAFGGLAPVGHRGELWIGGEGLALRYHGMAERTAGGFCVLDEVGARAYRSGDQARYRSDGVLEFFGRTDDQIQVRGYRVEPGEIEAALRAQVSVLDAAVVQRLDPHGHAQLVGYVVLQEGPNAPSPKQLVAALRALLPAYMVPRAVMVLLTLPRTANGKLDRKALPEPEVTERVADAAIAPRTETERRLLLLWERMLGTSGLGIHDNFFEHGGHSLLAVRLVATIQSEFGQRIDLVALFHDPTPAGVATLLERGETHSRVRCIEVLRAGAGGLPLVFVGSPAQARQLADNLPATRGVYALNMFGLYGEGDVPSMEVSWVAEQFEREVRALLPDGPYALAGYCHDAKLAYEIASRLKARGSSVPLLALVDALWWMESEHSPRSTRVADVARQIRTSGLGVVRGKAQRFVASIGDVLSERATRVHHRVRSRLGLPMPWLLAHRMMVSRYLAALHQHRCGALDASTVVYVAAEWGLDAARVQAGAQVTMRSVPGDHTGMFSEHQVTALAAQLEGDLAAVEA